MRGHTRRKPARTRPPGERMPERQSVANEAVTRLLKALGVINGRDPAAPSKR
jgi:hypothetical protein